MLHPVSMYSNTTINARIVISYVERTRNYVTFTANDLHESIKDSTMR